MAEYKGIKGFKVQYLSADPSDPNIGQTWYNSTSKDLKYTGVTTAGSWATGNPLNTARYDISAAGIQTAALAFGGTNSTPAVTGATEEYDGSAWTTSPGSLNVAIAQVAGCGIQTAALSFGNTPATEEYNGSTWTATVPLTTTRGML
jgi:hypothetical protein